LYWKGRKNLTETPSPSEKGRQQEELKKKRTTCSLEGMKRGQGKTRSPENEKNR